MGTDRVTCGKCHRKCSGQVLSVGDTYFHHYCFTCQKCGNELGEDAFYNKDGSYYCAKDYLDNFGEHCFKCNEFLEGEVITALGNTFHLDCFTCGHCKKFFPPGETVIFDGQDYVCENCDYGVDSSSRQPLHKCAGCRKDIEHGQALMALDQHWHPDCFTCQKCGIVLHGEYMGKDGFAFCEKDYQSEFGVTCAGCEGYITGKVLQAGDKHYHPQCSRCAKCGQMFGEGEEMYLQGSEIWHPECSEMVREMERAEKERAEMEQREAEHREMEEEERRREMEEEARRREMEEEARRREMEQREAERQEAERRENERRDAERRETERREAERREVERREEEMREVERRDAERRDAERRDAERREADRREAERRDAERLEAERREAEQRERERREREIEAERREAERREKEQLEIERRDRERREMEYRESQRLDADRRDAERKREYYQPGKQVDVDIGRRASPDFDDLPPPPRPEELPPGPPAPPTRTDSRAKDWKARYGSLPRTGSGSLNGDAQEVQMRNGPSRPRPYSYHESSHNSYDETTQPTPVSPGGKYKTSVQLKIGRSSDDSMVGRVTSSSSSSVKSPAEVPIFTYRQLKVDNYRLPRGVDKKNLETYLSDEEFREVFKMAREDFYQLPKWKQHDQKKKVKLF